MLYENEHNFTIKDALKDFKSSSNHLNIAIIIGPEGGLSQDEVLLLSKYQNVKCVSLGKRILRTETAGLAAVSMLIYEFDL